MLFPVYVLRVGAPGTAPVRMIFDTIDRTALETEMLYWKFLGIEYALIEAITVLDTVH